MNIIINETLQQWCLSSSLLFLILGKITPQAKITVLVLGADLSPLHLTYFWTNKNFLTDFTPPMEVNEFAKYLKHLIYIISITVKDENSKNPMWYQMYKQYNRINLKTTNK